MLHDIFMFSTYPHYLTAECDYKKKKNVISKKISLGDFSDKWHQ